MMPAPSRRATIPAALSTATPTMASAASDSAPAVVRPCSKAGTTTRSTTRPITQAEATVMVP